MHITRESQEIDPVNKEENALDIFTLSVNKNSCKGKRLVKMYLEDLLRYSKDKKLKQKRPSM